VKREAMEVQNGWQGLEYWRGGNQEGNKRCLKVGATKAGIEQAEKSHHAGVLDKTPRTTS